MKEEIGVTKRRPEKQSLIDVFYDSVLEEIHNNNKNWREVSLNRNFIPSLMN